MFFVVFIQEAREYFIIPSNWIKEIEVNWKKFINNGLNTNQIYTVFYSRSTDAVDDCGKPNPDFAPMFCNEIKKFPEDGCYFAKIAKYFG